MAKSKDRDIQDVMAAESSRGKRRPQSVQSIEERRLLRRVAEMILDRNCELSDYVNVLREDFGLQEGSAEIQEYLSWWRRHRKP
jgi:hypothetical protein